MWLSARRDTDVWRWSDGGLVGDEVEWTSGFPTDITADDALYLKHNAGYTVANQPMLSLAQPLCVFGLGLKLYQL